MAREQPTRAFIVDKKTNERLEFQYNPPEIKDAYEGGWVKQKVPGSTHPRLQWTAGGQRTLTMKVQFYRESSDVEEVKKKCAFLRSLQFPDYGNDGDRLKAAPHVCLFVFGTLYNLQVIVDKVDIRYYNLYSPEELEPRIADVELTLIEFQEVGVSFDDIRPGGFS